ncbi:MAG TPA: LysR substrate-binding domain-containing protein [Candidatus Udaeobacter sp.]|nr:LysR substrate-binding domain-containing protein [Candidatus Udaeobacter sp.]
MVLEELRLFLTVVEEGSLRRAAERAHISQSAVTRQMQLLEHDLGGRILERTSTGVRPTTGGYTLVQKAKLLLADYDSTMSDVRRLVRGEGDELRIGYLASAGQQYLGEPISALHLHPKLKMKMIDLTPGEVIKALRRGEIDLALTYLGMDLLSRDFYTRKIDDVPSVAVLPIHHRLASQKQIPISQLKHECFLQVADTCAPGYNQRVGQFCRRFGKFRPRFAPVRAFESIAESLAISGNENAISLNPMFVRHLKIPNVAIVPIADKGATWDLFVAWQRGKTAAPVRVLIDALGRKSRTAS